MFRTATLLCVMSLTAIGTVQAADAIAVEKLTRAQLQEALKSASDDTVIENNGQTKTKAQWQNGFQAKYDMFDPAKLKELGADRKATYEAAAKAFKDQQDQDIASRNAEAVKEYEELKAR
jgi:hypothetical protein